MRIGGTTPHNAVKFADGGLVTVADGTIVLPLALKVVAE